MIEERVRDAKEMSSSPAHLTASRALFLVTQRKRHFTILLLTYLLHASPSSITHFSSLGSA
jgi:hypothetical protein